MLNIGCFVHFHCKDYLVVGGICTCLGVSSDPMFLWISSDSCPLNFLLVRSHQVEIIIVKCLIQGCNNVTRARVKFRSCNQDHCKNDAFILSASLSSIVSDNIFKHLFQNIKNLYIKMNFVRKFKTTIMNIQ